MKKKKQRKTRLVIFGLVCLFINGFIIYSLYQTWEDIFEKQKQKNELTYSLNNLKQEEESLKVELNKLQDSSYIAKYAREKLFYSKKDEYILKIK